MRDPSEATLGRQEGLLRPWLTVDNEIITHKAVAKRERHLMADVLGNKQKIKQAGEERRLLDKTDPWLQRLIIAALETGCRRGELLSFLWADVNLARGVVTVRADNAKSGKSRQIPISPRLGAILKMIEHDPAGNPHKPTAYVFGNVSAGK